MVSVGSESLQRDGVNRFRPNQSLHVFLIAVSRIFGAGAGPEEPLSSGTLRLELAEAFTLKDFLVYLVGGLGAIDRHLAVKHSGERGFRVVRRHRFLKRRIEQYVNTT